METVLKIQDLTVGYGKDKTVLDGLSLEIGRGELFGLLGPNGSGKTTLIKSILGLLKFQKGAISLFGDVKLSAGTKARLGYMPEVARLRRDISSETIASNPGTRDFKKEMTF